MDETAAREEICRVGASLYARGYVHASAGNISVRLADGWLITPTDACLGTLDPARLAHIDSHGVQTAPARRWRCTGASTKPHPRRAASSTRTAPTW